MYLRNHNSSQFFNQSYNKISWFYREQIIKTEYRQDATNRCLLLTTSVSTCFGQHYAHLHEIKGPVTVFGVLFCFCWIWLVAVVEQKPS